MDKIVQRIIFEPTHDNQEIHKLEWLELLGMVYTERRIYEQILHSNHHSFEGYWYDFCAVMHRVLGCSDLDEIRDPNFNSSEALASQKAAIAEWDAKGIENLYFYWGIDNN